MTSLLNTLTSHEDVKSLVLPKCSVHGCKTLLDSIPATSLHGNNMELCCALLSTQAHVDNCTQICRPANEIAEHPVTITTLFFCCLECVSSQPMHSASLLIIIYTHGSVPFLDMHTARHPLSICGNENAIALPQNHLASARLTEPARWLRYGQ